MKACRTGADLVEGTVTAAGINFDFFAGLGGIPGQTAAITGPGGNLYLIVQVSGLAGVVNGGHDGAAPVPAARSGIDDEQVFHGVPP